jgi:hypothetical protein
MRKLRIVSDGTPFNTKVLDAETGEDLQLPVTTIVWRSAPLDRSGLSVASVELAFVSVDVIGDLPASFVDPLRKLLGITANPLGGDSFNVPSAAKPLVGEREHVPTAYTPPGVPRSENG